MFWKEKKIELEVKKTIMGYSPFSGLCRDREFSVVTENSFPVSHQWPSVAAGFSLERAFCVATRSSQSRHGFSLSQ